MPKATEVTDRQRKELLRELSYENPKIGLPLFGALKELVENKDTPTKILTQVVQWLPTCFGSSSPEVVSLRARIAPVWMALIEKGLVRADSEVVTRVARHAFPFHAFERRWEKDLERFGRLEYLRVKPANARGRNDATDSVSRLAGILLARVPDLPAVTLERMASWWVPGNAVQFAICNRADVSEDLRKSIISTWIVSASLLIRLRRATLLRRTHSAFDYLAREVEAHPFGYLGHRNMLDIMFENAWDMYTWELTFRTGVSHHPQGLIAAIERLPMERLAGIPSEAWLVLSGAQDGALRQMAWLELGRAPEEGSTPKRWIVPRPRA